MKITALFSVLVASLWSVTLGKSQRICIMIQFTDVSQSSDLMLPIVRTWLLPSSVRL